MGNGALSVGVAGDGTLTSLHWPSPTAFDHLEVFANKNGRQKFMGSFFGAFDGDQVIWFGVNSSWGVKSQVYKSDADNVLITELALSNSNARAVVTDFVHPTLDVLVRRLDLNGSGLSPAFYENLAPCVVNLPEYAAADWLLDYQNDFAVYFDSSLNAMVHFAPNAPSNDWQRVSQTNWSSNSSFGIGVYFAIGPLDRDCVPLTACGSVSVDLNFSFDNQLCEGASRAFSAMRFPGSSSIAVGFAAGSTRDEAVELLQKARKLGFVALLNDTVSFWREKVATAALPASTNDPLVMALAKRAVISVWTAMDRESFSVAASIDHQLP